MPRKPFEVLNPDSLTANLRKLDAAVSESTLRRAAVAGARVFLDEMRLRVPVKTGAGRDALLIAYDAEVSLPGKIASYIVTWSKKAYYLRYVEFGRSGMAADPFMRPSYEAKKTAAAQAVQQVVEESIRTANVE